MTEHYLKINLSIEIFSKEKINNCYKLVSQMFEESVSYDIEPEFSGFGIKGFMVNVKNQEIMVDLEFENDGSEDLSTPIGISEHGIVFNAADEDIFSKYCVIKIQNDLIEIEKDVSRTLNDDIYPTKLTLELFNFKLINGCLSCDAKGTMTI